MPATIDPVTGQLDAVLTAYATAYRQNRLISDLLFPRLGVPEASGKYFVFGREDQELLEQDLTADGAAAQQITASVSSDTYSCQKYSRAAVITAKQMAQSKIGDLRQRRTRTIMNKLLLHKELRAITLINSTAAITNYDSLDDAAEKWSDPDNSNPLDNVDAGKDAIRKAGVEANVMVISPTLLRALRQHSKVRDAFKYTTPGSIGVPQLANYFDISQVLVSYAGTVSKAGVFSFLMGDHAFLGFVDPGAGMEDASFGKTFVWEGAPNTAGGFGTIVGPYGVPSAESEEVSVRTYYDQKVTFVAAAYLIANAA